MASFNLPNVDGMTSIEELKNAVGKMAKELTWLMQNLDTRNINELHAEKIVAGSIQAEQIAAGAIVADKIDAGAVTAEKISVTELSAITANMGKLTSGEIYGAYIATRELSYPRAEMSNTGNFFAVHTDVNNNIKIMEGVTGDPTIVFTDNGVVKCALGMGFGFLNFGGNTDIVIGTTEGKNISISPSGYVAYPSWSKVFTSGTARTLQQELDDIWTALASKSNVGHAHSVSIPNHNHGNVDNVTSGGGTFTVS